MAERRPVGVAEATAVLPRWPDTADARVSPLGTGLINDTFAVQTAGGDAWVLQRVHPVFSPEIHHNIARVTAALHAHGMATPRIVPTRDDALWAVVDEAPWRVMTRVPGVTFDRVASPRQAERAAALLGRFHAAAASVAPEDFVGLRAAVHDTPAHLARLRTAIDAHRGHRLYDRVAPLATDLLAQASALPPLAPAPPRIVHGDPKLNNVVFAGAVGADANRAVAWIDLDTVGPMPLAFELGDAWRSWCNPAGEDEGAARFDLAVFEASLRGWGSTAPPPSAAEREALLGGVEWITLELAARFLADALHEDYFGWDRRRFASRGEHNLVRARGQWALHRAVVAVRAERARLLQSLLAVG